MKYRLLKPICLCLVAMLTGCGHNDTELDPAAQQIIDISFTNDTVYAMAGDAFTLTPQIYPETASSSSVYLRSGNAKVVDITDKAIYALGEGTTYVIASSMDQTIADTCVVVVIPRWVDDPYRYLNDMVVYAHISHQGLVPKAWIKVAAFYGNELRGTGEPMNTGRSLWRFRIWSNQSNVSTAQPGNENISFRLYDPQMLQIQTSSLTIFDGQSHGTPVQPLELTFK